MVGRIALRAEQHPISGLLAQAVGAPVAIRAPPLGLPTAVQNLVAVETLLVILVLAVRTVEV